MVKKKRKKNSRKNNIDKNPQNQKMTEEKDVYVLKGYDIYIFLIMFILGIIFLLVYLFGLIMVLIN